MAFAIVKSDDEQKKRNEKLAQEEAQAEGTTTAAARRRRRDAGRLLAGGRRRSAIDRTASRRSPGNVTITYNNPSPVPHSIAVATANGNVLGQVQPFTNGKESVP